MGCMMSPVLSSGGLLCDLSVCVFVCVDVPAELSDELGQQHGGH